MPDKKFLKDIVRTTQETFGEVAGGTHSTEAYDDTTLYEVELGDPIVLGAPESNSYINEDNQLIIESTVNIRTLAEE